MDLPNRLYVLGVSYQSRKPLGSIAPRRHRLPASFLQAFAAQLLIAASPLCANAQTYTCLPDAALEAQPLRDHVVALVTGTDSGSIATRKLYHLPALSASKVTVVTTTSVCNRAGDAYHTTVARPGTPRVSRTLVVIKVGRSRYVVLDPNERAGEFQLNDIFDSKWHYLIGLTS